MLGQASMDHRRLLLIRLLLQGSLDILVQRSGKQTGDRVTFIQNNFYHDAFFLKTLGERLFPGHSARPELKLT